MSSKLSIFSCKNRTYSLIKLMDNCSKYYSRQNIIAKPIQGDSNHDVKFAKFAACTTQ